MVLKKKLSTLAVFILIIVNSIYSKTQEPKPFLYTVGAGFYLERRYAERTLEDIGIDDQIDMPFGLRANVFIGRHFYPLRWLRIEFLGEYSFGNAKADSVADFLSVKHYKAGGVDLNIHLVRPIDNSFALFTGCGGGFLITSLKADNNEQGYGEFKIRTTSPVFNVDAGCEIYPGRKAALSIAYSYRLWSPTKFTDDRDMPLQGADYKEINHSHGIVFKLLFGKKE